MHLSDSLAYIKWIREQPCIITNRDDVVACHLKHVGSGGKRVRPNLRHFTALPMIPELHHELDNIQHIEEFGRKHGVNLWEYVWIFNERFYRDKQ